MATPETRESLTAILAAAPTLAGWTVYGEPPEHLAGGLCIVVTPQDPYLDWSTFGTLTTRVSVTFLVPRRHGPAMDVIDPALTALRAILAAISGAGIGDTRMGIIEEVGASEYIAAMTDVTLS